MLFDPFEHWPQCHDVVTTRFKVSPAAFRAVVLRVRVKTHGQTRVLVPDPRGDHRDRNPLQVHQSRASVPSGVQLDVPHPGSLHRVAPIARQHRRADTARRPRCSRRTPTRRRRHRAPGAHGLAAPRPTGARTPTDPAAAACAAKWPTSDRSPRSCRPRSPGCSRWTAFDLRGRHPTTAARQSRRAADPTAPTPRRALSGRWRSQPAARSPRPRCRYRPPGGPMPLGRRARRRCVGRTLGCWASAST